MRNSTFLNLWALVYVMIGFFTETKSDPWFVGAILLVSYVIHALEDINESIKNKQ